LRISHCIFLPSKICSVFQLGIIFLLLFAPLLIFFSEFQIFFLIPLFYLFFLLRLAFEKLII
jgi:hypothetical protein